MLIGYFGGNYEQILDKPFSKLIPYKKDLMAIFFVVGKGL